MSNKAGPSTSMDQEAREQGATFDPKFDSHGLITTVVTHHQSNEVLMVAFMNQDAINQTLATRRAHFWSRSRQRLWMKGETSGHVIEVTEVLVDCDQDALVVKGVPKGPTCHTNARSCFYRRLALGEGDGNPIVKVNT